MLQVRLAKLLAAAAQLRPLVIRREGARQPVGLRGVQLRPGAVQLQLDPSAVHLLTVSDEGWRCNWQYSYQRAQIREDPIASVSFWMLL
jgi:hypothetical protein